MKRRWQKRSLRHLWPLIIVIAVVQIYLVKRNAPCKRNLQWTTTTKKCVQRNDWINTNGRYGKTIRDGRRNEKLTKRERKKTCNWKKNWSNAAHCMSNRMSSPINVYKTVHDASQRCALCIAPHKQRSEKANNKKAPLSRYAGETMTMTEPEQRACGRERIGR